MARIIDVIEHANVMPDELAYREPQSGQGDFRMGSQCIVQEYQAAAFVYRGKVADVLGPGAHTLSTANIPILSSLVGMVTSGRTPFTAYVYFINTKPMPQVKWGTNPPITVFIERDPGVMQLMTSGTVELQITDPTMFLGYAMNQAITRMDDIKERIQTTLVGTLGEILSDKSLKIKDEQDANALLSQLEGASIVKVSDGFKSMGMSVRAFEARNFQRKQLTVEEIINLGGNAENFFRLRQLDVAQTAAANPGMGGTLASAGLGLGVGQSLGAMFGQQQQQAPATDPNALMMQQMMMQQMQQMQQQMMQMQQNQGGAAPAPQAPAPAAAAGGGAPQTREEIQAMIDKLDMRFMNGEISETTYNDMKAKWQERLNSMA